MGATPTTVNSAAKTVDQIINTVIFDGAVVAAEAAIKLAFPFLAWPGLSQLVDLVINYIAKQLYVGVSDYATLQVIQFQTNAERHAYADAEFQLRQAHLSGDPVALAQATEKFKIAFRSLVHSDGST